MAVRGRGTRSAVASTLFRTLERLSLVGGICLLAWPVFVLADSAYVQWSGKRQLERAAQVAAFAQSGQAAPQKPAETIVVRKPGGVPATTVPPGSVLGSIDVPRLGLSYVLLEGTDNRTLDKSVGHVEGTAAVGSAGNISVAGHRDTHFRKLEWIHRDDDIIVTAPNGSRYNYRVEWIRLFKPADIQVLDASHGPALTLITCFPFEYVGSAPLRLIVRALPDERTRVLLGAPATPSAPTP
jgi:sortase A